MKTRISKTKRMAPQLVRDSTSRANFSLVRKRVNDLVAREALEMVGGAVNVAKDGQYGAMKCLFEIVGLFPAPVESVEDPGEGLVEKLLRQLEIEESSELESVPRKNPQHPNKTRESNPVE